MDAGDLGDLCVAVMCTAAAVGIVIEVVLDVVIWAIKVSQRRTDRQ